jgi:hypothetical protein
MNNAHLKRCILRNTPLKIMTLINNIEDELESVRTTFVKHLQQDTSCISLSSFKHLQESLKV